MKFLMDLIMPPSKRKKGTIININGGVFVPLEDEERGTSSMTHSCKTYCYKVLNNLHSLRINNVCCDVSIVVDDKEFRAHKAILAACSPYFHAMFAGGLCEKDKESVELHGISSYIFDILLEFIYSGEVVINQNNVQELMIAADMVEIDEVVVGCSDFLTKELQPQNAIGIYRFAVEHNLTYLSKKALEYIEKNFPKVSQEDEFCDLNNEHVIKLLSSENLQIDAEVQVLEAALKWINHDILERRQYVFDILKFVRLPLLSFGQLEKEISHCVDNSLKIALKSIYGDLLNRKGCLVPLDVGPRKCAKKYIYVIGGTKRDPYSLCDYGIQSNYIITEKFDTFSGIWHKIPDMIENCRQAPGVAALNNQIYVVGGEVSSHVLSSCEQFDLVEKKWSPISKMLIPRCDFGLCSLNGYLYAMGGWANADINGTIERYDPRTDSWLLVGNLPEPRFSMAIVSYEGLIYLVGGCSPNQRNMQDFMSYNPATGEWKNLQSMSTSRFHPGVAVLNDNLYVVGGTHRQGVLNSVERYCFKTGQWSTMPAMSVERSAPAVAALGGLLYVIGGAQMQGTQFYKVQCSISSVECFNPLTNSWSKCPPLSETRSEAAAIVV